MSKKQKKQRKNFIIDLISAYAFLFFLYYFSPAEHKGKLLPLIFFLSAILVLIFISELWKKKRKKQKYLSSSLHVIDNMKGEEFEEFLQAHFEKQGYKATLTPASNDYGADLILEKNGEKIAVQAKRYRNKVSNAAVQEVAGAMGYYECNKGMVITNNFFTSNAINLAKKCQIELWDRNTLNKNFKIEDMNSNT